LPGTNRFVQSKIFSVFVFCVLVCVVQVWLSWYMFIVMLMLCYVQCLFPFMCVSV